MQAALNKTRIALENKRAALMDNPPAESATANKRIAYSVKIEKLNVKINQYTKKLNAFNEKVMAFNNHANKGKEEVDQE